MWGRLDSNHTGGVGGTPDRYSNSEGGIHDSTETGQDVVISNPHQPQAEPLPGNDLHHRATAATVPSSSAVADTFAPSPVLKATGAGPVRTTFHQDEVGRSTMNGSSRHTRELSSSAKSSLSPTTAKNLSDPAGQSPSWARRVRTSSGGGNGSGSRSGSSGGASGRKSLALDRRRISTTPVWKRPAVPLSKPYVPVPRKESGRV